MGSILALARTRNYGLCKSDSDLQVRITDKDQNFICGWIAELIQPSDKIPEGTSQFTKGRRNCIRHYVREAVAGPKEHLHAPSETVGKRIAQLSFPKDQYAARTRLASLINQTPYEAKVDAQSLMKSREELQKIIKTNIPWHDTMVFFSSERDYLDSLYKNEIALYTGFLNNPSKESKTFWTEFNTCVTPLRTACAKIKKIHSARSVVLFPPGDNKQIVNFRKLNLQAKVSSIKIQDFYEKFRPDMYAKCIPLPNITRWTSFTPHEITYQRLVDIYDNAYTNKTGDPANPIVFNFLQTVESKLDFPLAKEEVEDEENT